MKGWKGFAAGALLIVLAAVGFGLGKIEWDQALLVLGVGLGIWGIRDKLQRMSPLVILLVASLVFVGCATDGTGGEASPNTASTATGGYVGAGAEQRAAGATYLIHSRGTTYNIDTDGSPKSEEAATAIAEALRAYEQDLADLREALKQPDLSVDERADLRSLLRFIVAEKRLFMQEAKGAFGVSITVQNDGDGIGSSTVDTAGTTGQDNAGVPPETDTPPPTKKEAEPKEPDGDGG